MSLIPALTALTVAWAAEPVAPLAGSDGLAVVQRAGAPVVLVLGPEAIEAWDLEAGARVWSAPQGARDAAVTDLDGDGLAELLTCGEAGLVGLAWEGPANEPRAIDAAPCRALRVQAADGATSIVAAGERAHLWRLDAGGLVDQGLFGGPLGASPLLAARGPWLAVSAVGATEVTELSPYGPSTFATGGPIAGLAPGPRGWAWSLPDRAAIGDVTHREVPVAAAPGRLLSADLDGGGGPELYALHPDALGEVEGGARWPLPFPVIAHAVGDVDADGCDEIVLLGAAPSPLEIIEGECSLTRAHAGALPAPAPLPPPADPPPPPRVARLLGTSLPAFVGPAPNEIGWPRNDVLLGLGWVVGGTIRGLPIQVPTFPALAFGTELGGPRARWYAGLDSAGFFLWTWEGAEGQANLGMHLANVTVGRTFGGSDLSAGPFVTAGLLNAGAGVRAVWTPFGSRPSAKYGLEARLTVFAPRTGEAMLLYVSRTSTARVQQPATAPRDPFCTRFELAVGASVGVSATRLSWEFVGSNATWAPSGSPALAAACESGEGSGWILGMETAPFFSYVTPPDGERLHHLASLTFGGGLGGEALRVGPIATAGIWTLGGGARLVWAPFRDGHGQRHGFDLRAVALLPHAPSYEATLLYGVWLDPRR